MKKVVGFSLIEFLLNSALAAFLMLGLIQVYLSDKQTFLLQQAMLDLQENAQFTAHYLGYSLRMAGNNNCDLNQPQNNIVQGFWSSKPPGFINRSWLVADSDIVVVKRCIKINQSYQYLSTAYYVAKIAQSAQTGLFEKIAGYPAQELVPNVVKIKINYVASNELSASQISDWNRIRAVQIEYLVTSSENVLKQRQNYRFNQQIITAPDKRLYQSWFVYVALRQATH